MGGSLQYPFLLLVGVSHSVRVYSMDTGYWTLDMENAVGRR